MKIFIKIFLCLLIGFSAKAQTPLPFGLPNPNSTSWYKVGWVTTDSGFAAALRDTTLRPRFAGTMIFWQHAGIDSNAWFHDGRKWFHYVKTSTDIINVLGYTPLANITSLVAAGANVTITGNGTPGNPYVISASGGGGPPGINQVNFTNQNGFTGAWLNNTGPTATLSIGTSVNGLAYGNGTSLQAAGIGAGLQFVAGVLSNTITNNNQLANGNLFISNITGLINAGANITITGLGTPGSPYVINSTGGGGGSITGAGNFNPLFTTTVVGTTITFVGVAAAQHTFFGNFTSGSAIASFGSPVLASADFANQGTTSTLLHGNAGGNPSWGVVQLASEVGGILQLINGGNGTSSPTINVGIGLVKTGGWGSYTLSLDTANLKDTLFLVNAPATFGASIGWVGGNDTLYLKKFIAGLNVTITQNVDSSITIAFAGPSGVLPRTNITSGTSLTLPSSNRMVQFDFAAPPAAYSLTMPAAPSDQDIVNIQTGRTLTLGNVEISTLTIVANGGQNLNFNPVMLLNVGGSVGLRWNTTGAFWDMVFQH